MLLSSSSLRNPRTAATACLGSFNGQGLGSDCLDLPPCPLLTSLELLCLPLPISSSSVTPALRLATIFVWAHHSIRTMPSWAECSRCRMRISPCLWRPLDRSDVRCPTDRFFWAFHATPGGSLGQESGQSSILAPQHDIDPHEMRHPVNHNWRGTGKSLTQLLCSYDDFST